MAGLRYIISVVLSAGSVARTAFFEVLVQLLQSTAAVEQVVHLHEAFVPVVKFVCGGIHFDVLFVSLTTPDVPSIDGLLDNSILLTTADDKVRALPLQHRPQLTPLAERCIAQWVPRDGCDSQFGTQSENI